MNKLQLSHAVRGTLLNAAYSKTSKECHSSIVKDVTPILHDSIWDLVRMRIALRVLTEIV